MKTKEEYNEIKELTISQLRNFQESLERMAKGNMTLVDQFGAIQLVFIIKQFLSLIFF